MDTDISVGEQKNEYELAFLLINPEVLKSVLQTLKQQKISPFYQSQINQIKLAYAIKRHESAFFGFLQFECAPEGIHNIRNALAFNPEIIRFLIVTPVVKSQTREMRYQGRVPDNKPEERAPALTNEVLEQKLEEILK